jgi:hypothetical protein
MGIDLLERAAASRARFLRAERVDAGPMGGDATLAPAYLLTFDAGRVLVAADALRSQLELRLLETPGPLPTGRTPLDEEEPWWRFAGNSIARVWRGEGSVVRELRMQLREDHENPKVIHMSVERGQVRVRLEDTPHV